MREVAFKARGILAWPGAPWPLAISITAISITAIVVKTRKLKVFSMILIPYQVLLMTLCFSYT